MTVLLLSISYLTGITRATPPWGPLFGPGLAPVANTSAPGNSPVHTDISLVAQWVSCNATMIPAPIALCTLFRFATPCYEWGLTIHLGFHVAIRTPSLSRLLLISVTIAAIVASPNKAPHVVPLGTPPLGRAPLINPP